MKHICYCKDCKKFNEFTEIPFKRIPGKCKICGAKIEDRFIESEKIYEEIRFDPDFRVIEANYPRWRAYDYSFWKNKNGDRRESLCNTIVTGDTIPGKRIVQIIGIVSGSCSYNPAGLIGEGFLDKMGNKYMQNAIESAKKKMIESAANTPANAIISFKTMTSSSAPNLVIVTATGTAVMVERTNDVETEHQESVSNNSIPDEILKYKALYDQGILTQEEFEAKKKQLLKI